MKTNRRNFFALLFAPLVARCLPKPKPPYPGEAFWFFSKPEKFWCEFTGFKLANKSPESGQWLIGCNLMVPPPQNPPLCFRLKTPDGRS